MSKILSFTFLFFGLLGFNNPDSWELAKHKNEIQIYTRAYENSEIQEFKALMRTSKSIHLLEDLIEDVEEFPNWQLNIASVKILKRLENSEKYVWFVIETPWPFSDRDMVVNLRKSVNEQGVITFNIINVPDYLEEKEDLIRMREADGKWVFTPLPNGQTEVLYQFYADPAGNLPEWVINMFIVDTPYQTFINVRHKIGEE